MGSEVVISVKLNIHNIGIDHNSKDVECNCTLPEVKINLGKRLPVIDQP
jgi:hypothetical protein